MAVKARVTVKAVFLAAALVALGQGQPGPPPTILVVDVENVVQYIQDISDVSKFATDLTATTPIPGKNFRHFLVLGDIVTVNGQPAKGIFSFSARQATLATAPTAGQGIADAARGNVNQQTFEILAEGGTPIGSLMASGLGAGKAPPGAPMAGMQGNNAIVGGTGAFLGARGQAGRSPTPQDVPDRQASMSEDPAKRREIGGGKERFVLHVIPLVRPEILMTPLGPAISHANDFTLVSPSKPAAPGEVLSLFATGLGPTRPEVEPGGLFPGEPLAEVNSPVAVTVNGKPARLLIAVGFPGTVDGYQVNFQLSPDTEKGDVTIQVSTAWIASAPVVIQVQ